MISCQQNKIIAPPPPPPPPSLYCLTLLMLRLLSSKAKGRKDVWKPSKPYHVGIHWIALAEYFQMSTHVPEFWSFFKFFASSKLATSSIHGYSGLWTTSFWKMKSSQQKKIIATDPLLLKNPNRHNQSNFGIKYKGIQLNMSSYMNIELSDVKGLQSHEYHAHKAMD